MLTLLAKLLSILNSDATPAQLAIAITLAMLAGINGIFSLVGLDCTLLIVCYSSEYIYLLGAISCVCIINFRLCPSYFYDW